MSPRNYKILNKFCNVFWSTLLLRALLFYLTIKLDHLVQTRDGLRNRYPTDSSAARVNLKRF